MANPVTPVDFIQSEGVTFLAHLMGRLSDQLVRACEQWFTEYGLIAPPRTSSTLHVLYRQGARSITEIAAAISQSHPLVINWVRQLKALGLVESTTDTHDRRRTIVSLTESGMAEAVRLLEADKLIARAYETLLQQADAPVFDALWRVEAAMRNQSFFDRLVEAEKGCPLIAP